VFSCFCFAILLNLWPVDVQLSRVCFHHRFDCRLGSLLLCFPVFAILTAIGHASCLISPLSLYISDRFHDVLISRGFLVSSFLLRSCRGRCLFASTAPQLYFIKRLRDIDGVHEYDFAELEHLGGTFLFVNI